MGSGVRDAIQTRAERGAVRTRSVVRDDDPAISIGPSTEEPLGEVDAQDSPIRRNRCLTNDRALGIRHLRGQDAARPRVDEKRAFERGGVAIGVERELHVVIGAAER